MTDTNLHRKANACLADLKFLLGIVPAEWIGVAFHIRQEIRWIENPNEYISDRRINAAWQFVALVHEKIRNHNHEKDL